MGHAKFVPSSVRNWVHLLFSVAFIQIAAGSTPVGRSRQNYKPCPRACVADKEADQWDFYHDTASLAVCGERILLDFNLLKTIGDDPENPNLIIRACTLGDATTNSNYLAQSNVTVLNAAAGDSDFGPIRRSDSQYRNDTASICGESVSLQLNITARLSSWPQNDHGYTNTGPSKDHAQDISEALQALREYIAWPSIALCKSNIMFAYVRGSLVGMYSGSRVDQKRTAMSVLDTLTTEVQNNHNGASHLQALDLCNDQSSSGDIFGVVVDAGADFRAVQKVMRIWTEGTCVSASKESAIKVLSNVTGWGFSTDAGAEVQGSNFSPRGRGRAIDRRAECRSINIEAGDDCPKLASRCGIGSTAFKSFNKGTPNLCSTSLTAGQPVCCSSGTLPSTNPQPGADGTCKYHDAEPNDGCSLIAAKYGVSQSDLETFNSKTWGWAGCAGGLQVSQRLCVSAGQPPMPHEDQGAECGPTVPGAAPPKDGEELADLNPCPNSACCNVWGKCGLTSDFCVINRAATGNPGTSQPGANSCVSNCGMEIINNDTPPAQYRKVGYFEGWNFDRPCLHMHVNNIDKSYTHVHFAFGEITSGLDISIPSNVQTQWRAFIGAKNVAYKKILAFGGWDFSNAEGTSGQFRKAFAPGNRDAFASKLAQFAIANGLDGLDFDWEYPSATDIDGSEPGQEDDGENYLEFLKSLRAKLSSDKSISVATASSYWYLRGFPIKKMSEVTDYIVFMTYDLHGQWDVGNTWVMPGCKAGNCLRSHINATETHDSLVMMGKAGVPSHKVVVGVSSYGRSFKMSDAGCRGPLCTFLGAKNQSPAKKGRCTNTGGYISDFEIGEIIKKGGAIKTWYDEATDSDYLVYQQTEWVAYMSKDTKSRRTDMYKRMNYGGTSDWAIDLQDDTGRGNDDNVIYLDTPIYSGTPAQCTPPCQFVLPPLSLGAPTTISIPPYTTSLEVAVGVTTTITVTVNAITTTAIDYYNVNVTASADYTITPSASIDLEPVVTTLTISGSTQVRTLTLPPWPAITRGPPSNWNSTSDSDDDVPWPTTFPSPPDPGPITITSVSKTAFTPPAGWGDDDATTTTNSWPVFSIVPVETDVPESGEDDDGEGDESKSTCKLWFFWVCINWVDLDIHIHGWKWTIPPGIWGPGPPPIGSIKLPPGFEIKGKLPPWPRLTIPTAGPIPPPPKPADCSPAEASLCYTTSSFGTTVSGGSTKTTATQVTSRCATITGCNFRDAEATVTRDACSLNWGARRRSLPTATDVAAAAVNPDQLIPGHQEVVPRATRPEWACDHDPRDAIVLLQDPRSADDRQKVIKVLEDRDAAFVAASKPAPGFEEVGAPELGGTGVTGFYYVKQLGAIGFAYLDSKEVPEIAVVHYVGTLGEDIRIDSAHEASSTSQRSRVSELERRDMRRQSSDRWHLSQISFDKDKDWNSAWPAIRHDPANKLYSYAFDDNGGRGQTIYLIEKGMDVFKEAGAQAGEIDRIARVPNSRTFPEVDPSHGYYTATFAAGRTMGIAPAADLFWVQVDTRPGMGAAPALAALFDIGNHIREKDGSGQLVRPKNSVVVSMSWDVIPIRRIGDQLTQLMQILEEDYGVMFVGCAGNLGEDASARFPANVSPFLTGMSVVGAVDIAGVPFAGNGVGPLVNLMAPGVDLPKYPGPGTSDGRPLTGTSYATPMVAGLAAYLRAHPFFGIQNGIVVPSQVRQVLELLRRPLSFRGGRGNPLMAYNGAYIKASHCPAASSNRLLQRQDGGFEMGDSCPAPGSPGGNDGGGSGTRGPPVTFRPGPLGPLCSVNCGKLCQGYYCSPNPSGVPPDFFNSPAASPTATGPPITGLPTLTTTAPTGGPIPSNCASATTWSSCALGVPPGVSACQTYSDCGATFIGCSTGNARPGDGINEGYCVCGGSTFAQSTTTAVNGDQLKCGYTAKPTITTNPADDLPKTTNTAECKVCSVVGHNNMECTDLPNCTPAPTSTEQAEPKPSGNVCLSTFDAAFPDGSNTSGYKVAQANNVCGKSTTVSGFGIGNVCDLSRKQVEFELCGVSVQFEDSGPVWHLEQGNEECGIQLVVAGKRYTGVKVDYSDPVCSGDCNGGVFFGSMGGRLRFPNVPICE